MLAVAARRVPFWGSSRTLRTCQFADALLQRVFDGDHKDADFSPRLDVIIGGRKVFTNFKLTDLVMSEELGVTQTITPTPAVARPDDEPSERFAISVVEAARLLDLDRNTLYQMLKRGEGPPARRCGTAYRLDRDAVREWLRNGDRRQGRR